MDRPRSYGPTDRQRPLGWPFDRWRHLGWPFDRWRYGSVGSSGGSVALWIGEVDLWIGRPGRSVAVLWLGGPWIGGPMDR